MCSIETHFLSYKPKVICMALMLTMPAMPYSGKKKLTSMIAPATSLMMRKSAALPEARFASEEPPKLVGALAGVGTGPGTGDAFDVGAGPGIGAGAAPGAGVVLAGA